VGFAPADWLRFLEASVGRHRRFRQPSPISHELLLLQVWEQSQPTCAQRLCWQLEWRLLACWALLRWLRCWLQVLEHDDTPQTTLWALPEMERLVASQQEQRTRLWASGADTCTRQPACLLLA
jgi:hypothetical protein